MQSLVGAPRLIAAIANDRILPFLEYFTTKEGQEPRRALLLTVTITLAGVLVGNLDLITPIITMFFLLCYAGVNLSCILLSLINAPSWRPRWQHYHWTLSTLGLLLCLCIMFLISWIFSIVALGLALLTYLYVSEHGKVDNWGDGIKSLRLQFALKTLRGMDHHVHPKNWCAARPRALGVTGFGWDWAQQQQGVAVEDVQEPIDPFGHSAGTPGAVSRVCGMDSKPYLGLVHWVRVDPGV